MKKLLLFATFIYFLLGILTYHPDNKVVLNWASLNNGAVWNIWKVNAETLGGAGQFNYPPLHFYLDKLQYFISKPIGGEGYYEWLSGVKTNDLTGNNLTRYSLAMKIPLMFFSFLTAYLIFIIAKQNSFNRKQSLIASAIWLFNPITLYSIPIMGQNDVMAIAFFLFGWYLLNAKKLLSASILFGLSASTKMFPLLWVPLLLVYEKNLSIKKKIGLFLGSISVYMATLLPFISNPVFRHNVLGRGIDRMFIARIDLGFNDFILIVPLLLMILVMGIFSKLKNTSSRNIFIRQTSVLLLMNMIFLFFNHFHPQWFLWLVPFWIFWFLKQRNSDKLKIILITLGVILSWILIIFLFNDAALTLGMLSPLNNNLATLPSIRSILLTKNLDVSLYNNYAHTFLAGIATIFFISWFKNEKNDLKDQIISFNLKLIKIPKFFKYLSLLVFSFIFIFTTSLVANMIPTPLAGKNPKTEEFLPLTEPVKKEFVASYNGLYRIDFKLSDNELNNFDDYKLIVKDENNILIHNQIFNGLNVGYQSTFRVDFPFLQPASLNKKYFVEIIPPDVSEHPLRVGSSSKINPNDISFQPFYKKPQGSQFIKYSLKESVVKSKNVLYQNKIGFIVTAILLWFAL